MEFPDVVVTAALAFLFTETGESMAKAGKSFQQIWRQMDQDRRKQAAEAFCTGSEYEKEQPLATAVMVQRLHLRPQKATKLPTEKKVNYLSSMALDEPLAGALLRAYLFTHQRPLLSAFLDQLGIQHDNGVIKAEHVDAPSAEALRGAVDHLRANFAAQDVDLYITALVASDPEVWANLEVPTAASE